MLDAQKSVSCGLVKSLSLNVNYNTVTVMGIRLNLIGF